MRNGARSKASDLAYAAVVALLAAVILVVAWSVVALPLYFLAVLIFNAACAAYSPTWLLVTCYVLAALVYGYAGTRRC